MVETEAIQKEHKRRNDDSKKENKMKKITCLLALTAAVSSLSGTTRAESYDEEMRAVWIATVNSLEFPKVKNNPQAQMEQYETYLDALEEIGINTVIVQVRPTADALYESEINPWSEVLTGRQGQHPGYDPLEFMIDEAHERDMSFHAWINPYRITQGATTKATLDDEHLALRHPEWTFEYKDGLYYNPEVEGVKVHIEETVKEIVENYDVDAIHMDDYFYPYNYPLPEGESKEGAVADQRRFHVTDMVRRVSEVIEETDDTVEFGISPFGIWKNDTLDPTGSKTTGSESYHAVFADTRTWIQEEYIDYVVPQIYWEVGHKAADYETLVAWWADEVRGTDVELYIGQGIYKDQVAAETKLQLLINRGYEEVDGSVFFSISHLLANRQGVLDQVKQVYGTGVTPEVEEPEEPETEKPEPEIEEPEIEEPEVEQPETEQPEIEEPEDKEPHLEIQTEVIIGEATSTTDDLNIRKGPSVQYDIIDVLQQGDIVDIFGETQGWYAVRSTKGVEGFVKKEYLQVMRDVNKSIDLIINGDYIYPPVRPVLQNQTTLVPLRIISESLDAKVTWDGETRTILIEKEGGRIGLAIDQTTILVNGEVGEISVAPQIMNGTTMVPIRFISETLGAQVDWNGELELISIETK